VVEKMAGVTVEKGKDVARRRHQEHLNHIILFRKVALLTSEVSRRTRLKQPGQQVEGLCRDLDDLAAPPLPPVQ
jgi:hypothetical protein